MMSERLQSIKEDIKHLKIWGLSVDDVKWLIQQAERAEELENRLNLVKESHLYLKEQNQSYKQSLAFYANRKTYTDKVSDEWGSATKILQDRGKIARQALEDLK